MGHILKRERGKRKYKKRLLKAKRVAEVMARMGADPNEYLKQFRIREHFRICGPEWGARRVWVKPKVKK